MTDRQLLIGGEWVDGADGGYDVVNPATEDLGAVASGVQRILAAEPPSNARVALRGMVEGMNQSFRSFGFGLILALVSAALINLGFLLQHRGVTAAVPSTPAPVSQTHAR